MRPAPTTLFEVPVGRTYALVLLSGGLLSLAFPDPSIAPVAWVALVPLLALGSQATVRRGASLGLVFGLGFFGTLLSWISLVGWLAWGLLVLLQALWVALFGAGWALASRSRGRPARILSAAALWVAIEFLRATVPLGGFTWGELAQSQANLGWLLRSASLGSETPDGWLCPTITADALWCSARLTTSRG